MLIEVFDAMRVSFPGRPSLPAERGAIPLRSRPPAWPAPIATVARQFENPVPETICTQSFCITCTTPPYAWGLFADDRGVGPG